MDQVTVPRELLRQAYAEIRHLSRMANVDHTERSIIGELRTALEQPAVEPVAALRRIMSRLADLLDEDQFAEMEAIVLGAGVAPQAQEKS